MIVLAVMMAVGLAAPSTLEAPQVVPAPTSAISAPVSFMRSLSQGPRISLQSASRSYHSADPKLPMITLTGVMHIGDSSYYDQVESELAGHDIVLYESVMPAGVRPPGGATADERVTSTQRTMKFLRSMIEAQLVAEAEIPPSLDALADEAADRDSRAPAWIEAVLSDAWGRKFIYEPVDTRTYWLRSLGSDGVEGGEGEAADLRLRQITIARGPNGDSIQEALATALGLTFQLSEIDYSKKSWICSDMTVDELKAAFDSRGLSFDEFEGTFRTSGLQGGTATTILGLVRMADILTGGRVRQIALLVMAEILGDPSLMEAGLGSAGEALSSVILGDRNEVVWRDLQSHIKPSDSPPKIAVFYGAAHMADFHKRLGEIGYQAAEPRWMSVFTADQVAAGFDEATIETLRGAIKNAMQQRSGRAAPPQVPTEPAPRPATEPAQGSARAPDQPSGVAP
ncbi:MAG: hypothetical protein EXS00_02190 [Phycisphaerales bacterium]|nr:hypothetical protein [Phycisphaerales bacterium]